MQRDEQARPRDHDERDKPLENGVYEFLALFPFHSLPFSLLALTEESRIALGSTFISTAGTFYRSLDRFDRVLASGGVYFPRQPLDRAGDAETHLPLVI